MKMFLKVTNIPLYINQKKTSQKNFLKLIIISLFFPIHQHEYEKINYHVFSHIHERYIN